MRAATIRELKQAMGERSPEELMELLLHFCFRMKALRPSIFRNKVLQSLYERQLARIRKVLYTMHEDLQYDYRLEAPGINGNCVLHRFKVKEKAAPNRSCSFKYHENPLSL